MRIGSALVLLIVSVVAMWQGGLIFRLLVAVAAGLMIWELVRMLDPARRDSALLLGGLSGVAVLATPSLPMIVALLCLLALIGMGWRVLEREQRIWVLYGGFVLCAALSMVLIRDHLGFLPLVWLVAVVVATDVGGYFGGRLIGGPKFWPRFSPKKTWSGAVTGWIGAALVGGVFGFQSGVMGWVILISVLLSFLSQMGDIAESAVKRRAGVKDSSGLIPGHGGVLDRFDALLAAALALFVIALVTGFPVGLR